MRTSKLTTVILAAAVAVITTPAAAPAIASDTAGPTVVDAGTTVIAPPTGLSAAQPGLAATSTPADPHGYNRDGGVKRGQVDNNGRSVKNTCETPGCPGDVLEQTTSGIVTGAQPGDPNIAVSTTSVVEVANSTIAWWSSKTTLGTPTYQHSMQYFFSGMADNSCIDNETAWDNYNGHFMVSCWSTNNHVRLAVSQTSDPAAGWWFYDTASFGSSMDRPEVTVTADKVVLQAEDNSYGTRLLALNAYDVEHGVTAASVRKQELDQAGVYYARSVKNQNSSTTDAFYVTAGYFSVGGDQQVNLYKLSGLPNVNLAWIRTAVGTDSNIANYTDPAVLGGGTLVLAGRLSTDVASAVLVVTTDGHSRIAFAGQTACSNGHVCAYQDVYDQTTSTLTTGVLQIGSTGDVAVPAIGMNSAGQTFVTYTYSTSSTLPAAAMVGPSFSVYLQTATASGSQTQSEYWGDYFTTPTDPSDPTKVWGDAAYQYQLQGSGWGSSFSKASSTGLL